MIERIRKRESRFCEKMRAKTKTAAALIGHIRKQSATAAGAA
jgi:hypothetical protein